MFRTIVRHAFFFSVLFGGIHTSFSHAEDVLVTSSIQQSRECFEEFCFPSRIRIGDTTVPLRNIARKEYLFFDLYIAALYTLPEVKTPNDVLADTPKRLVLRYLRNFEKKDVVHAADTILSQNPRVNMKVLGERLARINLAYDRGIHEGDVFELEYAPTIGTVLRVNGQDTALIPGQDFQSAYFGIWLSEFPLDADLRDSLLRNMQKP